jgi:hypothetical protein
MNIRTRVMAAVWILFGLWAVFSVLFVVKLRDASLHPLQKDNPGGLLFLIGQIALGAAIVLIWRVRSNVSDTSREGTE